MFNTPLALNTTTNTACFSQSFWIFWKQVRNLRARFKSLKLCIRKLCSCSSQKSNNNNNCRLNNEEIRNKVIRSKETIYLGCPFSFTDYFIYRSGFLAVLCLYDLAFDITKLFISNNYYSVYFTFAQISPMTVDQR